MKTALRLAASPEALVSPKATVVLFAVVATPVVTPPVQQQQQQQSGYTAEHVRQMQMMQM